LLDVAVFGCLLLTWALAPHSIKHAAHTCTAAILLFAVSLFWRRSFSWHPLFRPLLVFLLLATLSTTFTSAPDRSWIRLSWFSLMLSVIVAANTLRTRARIIAMVVFLLASSSAILLRTGWQYTHGIGVRLSGLGAGNPLVTHGLMPDDIIQTLNGRPTRSPSQFQKVKEATADEPQAALGIARGAPIQSLIMRLDRRDLDAALHDPGLQVERGHPLRAQAGFYHYVPFAGFMCVVALLAWGMALGGRSNGARMLFLIVSVAAAAAVTATLTRTYLVAMLLGAFAAFWIISRRRTRMIAVVLVLAAFLGFTFWIEYSRGLGWIALNDPGTQFRLEMWRDGLHLARQHPLLGIGLDGALSGKWDVPAFRLFPLKSHFHSTPIQLAVDTGVFTLVAWLWIAASLFRLPLRLLRTLSAGDPWMRGVTLGVLGSTVAFYVASLVHYNQGDGEVMILMYILMGMAVAIERMPTARRRTGRSQGVVTPARQPVSSTH
jgi:hypothetical protein